MKKDGYVLKINYQISVDYTGWPKSKMESPFQATQTTIFVSVVLNEKTAYAARPQVPDDSSPA